MSAVIKLLFILIVMAILAVSKAVQKAGVLKELDDPNLEKRLEEALRQAKMQTQSPARPQTPPPVKPLAKSLQSQIRPPDPRPSVRPPRIRPAAPSIPPIPPFPAPAARQEIVFETHAPDIDRVEPARINREKTGTQSGVSPQARPALAPHTSVVVAAMPEYDWDAHHKAAAAKVETPQQPQRPSKRLRTNWKKA
ncbi:hypothetical protein HY256_09750, partial [Candidatus Sumerlaeota bacterium]|nr:hypothetical protein [Candidatus Sumerlaeota bacterium]